MKGEDFIALLQSFIKTIEIEEGKLKVNFLLETQDNLKENFNEFENFEFNPKERISDLKYILKEISLPSVVVTREIMEAAAESIDSVPQLTNYLTRNFKKRGINEEMIHYLSSFCKELEDTLEFIAYKITLLNAVTQAHSKLGTTIAGSEKLLVETIGSPNQEECRTYINNLIQNRDHLWTAVENFLDTNVERCPA